MKFLSVLLGAGFFQSLGITEWIYIGVGIAAVITLIVTVVIAVRTKKKEQKAQHVETVAEELKEAKAEPVAEQPTEPVAEQPAVVAEPVAEEKSEPVAEPVAEKAEEPAKVEEKPAAEPAVAEKPAAVEQKPAVSEKELPEELRNIPHKEVIRRGLVEISYDKSQTAKLMQADDEVKNYYDVIKNELLSYKGVRCRLSWKHEAFYKGRELVAKLKVRGKHLRLLLPLNPNDYVDTKYKVKDLSAKKNHADTPCGYSIKNDRRSVYAKDLIATVMEKVGAEKLPETEFVKYSREFPYDTTESLVYRKLIKVTYSRAVEGQAEGSVVHYEPVSSITAEEVTHLMTDKEAEESVEESNRIADKTKTGIVNVDVLSKTFAAGEKVTLAEIKKRVTGFNKKTTYVKVLARGMIDKPLIVEADDYSLDAVKMILLTGGTVIRTKKK